MEGGLLAGLGA